MPFRIRCVYIVCVYVTAGETKNIELFKYSDQRNEYIYTHRSWKTVDETRGSRFCGPSVLFIVDTKRGWQNRLNESAWQLQGISNFSL
jgi:hypothetical protein